ncbi:MAG: type II CAAX endopeptidase family protein [Calditrichia bacterium]
MQNITNSTENLFAKAPFRRREQIIEVLVFIFLIAPSMAFSFFAVKQGSVGFPLVAIATILRDLALVALVLFFIWRNSEPVLRIGWTGKNALGELFWGIILFVPMFYAAGVLERILISVGFTTPSTPLPSLEATGGIYESILGFFLVVIVAFSEETIFRGYLLLRFTGIFSSTTFAVILSAFIFSLGHGYEGTAGVVTVGFMGLVFAIVYLWRGSLIAPMVMHFLQDFIGIVLLPLVGGK